MKLYYSPASPFARKVLMTAMELGIEDRIALIHTHPTPGKNNAAYAENVNPLQKIPALETEEGLVIVDSFVICDYLNDCGDNKKVIPTDGPRRWQVLTGHTIANGIMDAALLNRYETFLRPDQYRWTLWVDEQWEKINNGLDWFDNKDLGGLDTIDSIALACALGYLDFRFAEFPWRNRFSKLSVWLETVSQSRSYTDTAPS